MKEIVFAIVLGAALGAQAEEAGLSAPLRVGPGSVMTPVASSMRTYTNASGAPQHDMLWQINGGENDPPEFMRNRLAVTGCGASSGLVVFVDPDGNMLRAAHPTRFEWRMEGSQAFDEVARRTCGLAASQRDVRTSAMTPP